MTTTGRTTACSANRRRAFGSLSSTDVSTTYTRVRTVASVELQGAVAISVTVILSAGRTLASARLDHGPKAVGLLNSPKSARERIRMPPSGRLPLRPCSVSYTHLRAHETVLDLVCRLLLEKKKNTKKQTPFTP